MGQAEDAEIVVLAFLDQGLDAVGDFRDRNDQVFRRGDFREDARAFQAVAAYFPDAVVGFDDVRSPTFFTDSGQFFHFIVQFVFVEGFDGNDIITAIFVVRQFQVAVIAGAADEVVIHEFDRCRVEAGVNQFRYQSRRLGQVREDGQDVEFIRRQGNELQRCLGDDAQGSFGTDDKLVQAEAGRAFL